MFVIGETVISDDVAERDFVCNLKKCKGACCIEGDSGAPLDEEEIAIMERVLPDVMPYLTEPGKSELEKQGLWVVDNDGDLATPTVNGRECAYVAYTQKGELRCAFELAHADGKTDWPKPISCHLYPIRTQRFDHYETVNYHQWHICSDACHLGRELGVPVYQFLREPLIRKYGQDWFDDLDGQVRERQTSTNR